MTKNARTRRRPGRPAFARALRPAFTLVELLVVIGIIVLILGIAIPGIAAMNAEARFTAGIQTVNATLTRAYYSALSDQNLVAVRFMPGDWDFVTGVEPTRGTGRMHMVTYNYVGSSIDPTDRKLEKVKFSERFERRPGADSVPLPEDVYVAPLEALTDTPVTVRDSVHPLDSSKSNATVKHNNFGTQMVLKGEIGRFDYDQFGDKTSGNRKNNSLPADDFLIVCDPRSGIRTGVPSVFWMKAYDPVSLAQGGMQSEVDRSKDNKDPYRRFSFSGIVAYRREPFVALGNSATGELRQDWLRRNGRPFLAHRYGGGLVTGTRVGQ